MAGYECIQWWNKVFQSGLPLPLFLIHDLGRLFASAGDSGKVIVDSTLAQVPLSKNNESALRLYVTTLKTILESSTVQRLATMKLSSDLLSILMIRSLSEVYKFWEEPTKNIGTCELAVDFSEWSLLDSRAMFSEYNNDELWKFVEHLNRWSLRLVTSVELLNLDTLKLMGLFEGRKKQQSGFDKTVDTIDLLNTFESVSAADIVDFSLDLLPSIMETHRSHAAQTFAMDGYSSLERMGSIDSMVLSEFAVDDEIFEQKLIFNEMLYFGHEKQKTVEKSLHYVLVDSSASMRGERHVFGRGLAVALLKKLMLKGEDVWFRFFDSSLYECFRDSSHGKSPLPSILSFRSEHGRNYEKVFRRILTEISQLRRQQGRVVTIYIVTHGQCHIEPFLMEQLATLASLYGIIILPSTDVKLDWIQSLSHTQIVHSDIFKSKAKRADRALRIVEDVDNTLRQQDVP